MLFRSDNNSLKQIPFVLFQLYGKPNRNILLPGTITGLSEENTPEWNPFKYMGSPFNLYRYSGVESKIAFELKLYWEDAKSYRTLKRNLNQLRELVFPDDEVVTINYNNPDNYSPLAFTGNFLYMTINGMYDGLFGFVDSLEISIDDNTSWANWDYASKGDGSTEKPFPTVINLSISFTVVHRHQLKDGKYKYNFTGEPRIMGNETIEQSKSDVDKNRQIGMETVKSAKDSEKELTNEIVSSILNNFNLNGK